MKFKSVLMIFIALPIFIYASDEQKYKAGDCITPTDKMYSWYGQYARVEAYSTIDGYSGKKYILTFPKYISNSSIFDQGIEGVTIKADNENCKL